MRALLLPVLLLAPLAGQNQFSGSASSQTYFVSSLEFASGTEATTPIYKVRPTLGSGVVPYVGAESATYVFTGGFPASLDSPVLGRPWLTAVTPFFVPQFGNPTLRLQGTEMQMGSNPSVTIGTQPAPVGGRTVHETFVTLPTQLTPGFQPVVLTNELGTTRLEEGVGVLPMLIRREPLNEVTPVTVRYQGSLGDLVVLGFGGGLTNTPFVLAGYHHALFLDIGQLFTTVVLVVGSPDGTLTLNGAPLPFTGLLYLQALALSANPGYAPGSWTNPIRL